jgi:hypothetical protein
MGIFIRMVAFALGQHVISSSKILGEKIANENGAKECAEIIVKRLET